MAIYHLSAQIISRSAGRSVVNAAAYRAAAVLYDDTLDRTFSYERKGGVEHKEILAPENAPAWATDREKLWNQVEAAENRKDAQLAREINVALPVELTPEQQVELMRGYVREEFVSRGMVADVCIHRDNPENPHAHIMLTTREIGPEGFGKKERAWNAKEVLVDWREGWADAINRHLYLAGQGVQVDHRSFEAQGLKLEPGIKLGVNDARRDKDGRDIIAERLAEHDRIFRENGEAILKNPQLALDAITHQRATFTRQDVGRWLNTHTADAEQFVEALDRVMASSELVAIGKDARANDRYTTREMLEVERDMVGAAQAMAERPGHEVSARHQQQGERVAKLSPDQRRAFDHIMQPADVAVVQGYAGSGKSFMLGAAREAWEAEGFTVKGGALAGKAAEGLQISAGIQARSLHAWEYAWSQGRDRLTSKDVLVIDEAGMVGSRQLGRVLDHVRAAGAKVVLVGDTRQLQAIEAGAPMRMIGERVGQVTMEDIRRQQDAAHRKASEFLARGEVSKVLSAYERIGRVHEHRTQEEARQEIVKDWASHRRWYPHEAQIMLAFKRDDVLALNLAAREKMREAGALQGKDRRVETPQGPRDFAIGDRIYFTKNDRQLGVLNGSLGTLEAGRGPAVTVRLDDGRRVAFDVREYNHLDHGYAATVHKAQGVTVDRAHVLADSHFDQHVAYVALTRHRDDMNLHWSREEFADKAKLHAVLGRERMKDVAVDYEKTVVDNRRLDAQVQPPAQAQAEQATTTRQPPEQRLSPEAEAWIAERKVAVENKIDVQRFVQEQKEKVAAKIGHRRQEILAQEKLEERLGRIEDAEEVLSRGVRMLAIYSPEKLGEGSDMEGPNAQLYAKTLQALKVRAQLEKELGLAPVVSRPVPKGLSATEALKTRGRGRDTTYKAWCAWRDAHTPKERAEARQGRGEGAKLFASYSQVRANEGEAMKQKDIELVKERELERGLGGPSL
jgi:Ti-type conjugative transfer relaxase TraA